MPTALIVEDEPDANRLLAMLVQLRGYATESAFTGGEALEIIRRQPPDIVLLDLMLPDINGYEVCRCLKAARTTSLIPVIMVTARVAAENRWESYGVGADDYVPKPYTPDQIFRAMASATTWRGGLGRETIEGLIPLNLSTEEDAQRLFARLSNLLLARTTLDQGAITRIAAALKEILHDGLGWARRTGCRLDSAIGFLIRPDHLTITLHDASGWLEQDAHLEAAERWPSSFRAAAFDQVIADEPGRRMTFTKRYLPSDASLCP
jgi:DNA-binding response OmpR family regulator